MNNEYVPATELATQDGISIHMCDIPWTQVVGHFSLFLRLWQLVAASPTKCHETKAWPSRMRIFCHQKVWGCPNYSFRKLWCDSLLWQEPLFLIGVEQCVSQFQCCALFHQRSQDAHVHNFVSFWIWNWTLPCRNRNKVNLICWKWGCVFKPKLCCANHISSFQPKLLSMGKRQVPQGSALMESFFTFAMQGECAFLLPVLCKCLHLHFARCWLAERAGASTWILQGVGTETAPLPMLPHWRNGFSTLFSKNAKVHDFCLRQNFFDTLPWENVGFCDDRKYSWNQWFW